MRENITVCPAVVLQALIDLRESVVDAYKIGRIPAEPFIRAGNVIADATRKESKIQPPSKPTTPPEDEELAEALKLAREALMGDADAGRAVDAIDAALPHSFAEPDCPKCGKVCGCTFSAPPSPEKCAKCGNIRSEHTTDGMGECYFCSARSKAEKKP